MERRFEVWGGFRGGFRVWGSGFRVYRVYLPLWPQVPENPPAWTQAEEDPGGPRRGDRRRAERNRPGDSGKYASGGGGHRTRKGGGLEHLVAQ